MLVRQRGYAKGGKRNPLYCKCQEFRAKTRARKRLCFFGAQFRCRIPPMKYGYAWVSTDDQSVDAQVRQLTKGGCKMVFREVASGAKTDRAQLRRLLGQLEAGDVLTAPSACVQSALLKSSMSGIEEPKAILEQHRHGIIGGSRRNMGFVKLKDARSGLQLLT
jgi:hypothetical protein